MKTNIQRAIVLFHTLCLIGINAFAQGVYWESKISSSNTEKERTDKAYYMPKMLKVVHGEDGTSAIIRLDKEMMMMIDPSEKSYWEVTFAEMERFMKGASAEMEAQMEQMPEEQRKMVEQMMGSRMKKEPKVETVKTGESKTISGFSCTKYLVKQDGKEEATVWATTDIRKFEVMQKDIEEFARRMKAMMPPGATDATGLVGGIDGFPIQTETSGGWKNVVTKIEERSTPANEFEPPSGYRKTDPPMMR